MTMWWAVAQYYGALGMDFPVGGTGRHDLGFVRSICCRAFALTLPNTFSITLGMPFDESNRFDTEMLTPVANAKHDLVNRSDEFGLYFHERSGRQLMQLLQR